MNESGLYGSFNKDIPGGREIYTEKACDTVRENRLILDVTQIADK